MESGNQVTSEDESIDIKKCDVVELVSKSSKYNEKKNVHDGEEAIGTTEVSKLAENYEGADSSKAATEVSTIDPLNENSTSLKETGKSNSAVPRKDKVGKGKSSVQGTTPPCVDAIKRIDGHPKRKYVRRALATGMKSDSSVSNNSAKSLSLSKNNSQASTEIKLKEVNKIGTEARVHQSSLASVASAGQPEPGNSGSRKAISKDPSLPKSICKSVDYNEKATKSAPQLKEDSDSHSVRSSSTSHGRRDSSAGFSLRLEERAKRRREFLMKLEAKVQAEEAEKNSLLEKSKVKQDAEIKQIRKSMIFKATPMPTFYKEPPPKVELKKIPITRPISPKLGRSKCSIATHDITEGIPRLHNDNNASKVLRAKPEKDTISSTKTRRKSKDRTQSNENTAARSESKKVTSETKANESVNFFAPENSINQEGDDEVTLTSATTVPQEVTVEG